MAHRIDAMSDFDDVVRTYEPQLRTFARRITRNTEDAEEIVQDAFFRAYRALVAMPDDKNQTLPLRSWLYTITLNLTRNRLRKMPRSTVSIDALRDAEAFFAEYADRRTPETLLFARLAAEQLDENISRLPNYLRMPARLRFIEDYNATEIATAFRQPVGTVKAQIHRAKYALRKLRESEPTSRQVA